MHILSLSVTILYHMNLTAYSGKHYMNITFSLNENYILKIAKATDFSPEAICPDFCRNQILSFNYICAQHRNNPDSDQDFIPNRSVCSLEIQLLLYM